jgi:MraZ protein
MFTAGVKLTDLDSNGRLLIPKDLKHFASIQSELVLSSSGNMIEIWNKSKYEKIVTDTESDFSKMAEEVMGNINNNQDE